MTLGNIPPGAQTFLLLALVPFLFGLVGVLLSLSLSGFVSFILEHGVLGQARQI